MPNHTITLTIILTLLPWCAQGVQMQIDFEDNKLLLQANGVALGSVLEKISKQTNIKFFITEKITTSKLVIKLDSLPLKVALDRLLKSYNRVYLYDDIGNIVSIHIYEESDLKLQLTDWTEKLPTTTNNKTGNSKLIAKNPTTRMQIEKSGGEEMEIDFSNSADTEMQILYSSGEEMQITYPDEQVGL